MEDNIWPGEGSFTEQSGQYVIFNLDERQYALGLSKVERVVPAAEWTPLPKAPQVVSGILNLEGRIIPVMNIRQRFGLPNSEIKLSDQIIVAQTRKRRVALPVDVVDGVVEISAERIVASSNITPRTEYISGVIKLADGLALIHDLDTFLSLEEEGALDSAVLEFRGQA